MIGTERVSRFDTVQIQIAAEEKLVILLWSAALEDVPAVGDDEVAPVSCFFFEAVAKSPKLLKMSKTSEAGRVCGVPS